MKKIKKIKRRVAALVISFFLTLGLTSPAFLIDAQAEAVEVLSGSSTVADIILTMYAGAGSIVTNNTWINDLYNSFGSEFGTIAQLVDSGYLVNQGGTWVDAGLSEAIEALPAYSELGIDEAFSLTALETGAAAVGGGTVLSTITGTLATTGVLGCAVGAGIGLGILANHLIEQFGKGVYFGSQITSKDIINTVPDGARSSIYFWKQTSAGSAKSGYLFYSNAESISVVVHDGVYIWYGIITKDKDDIIYRSDIRGNAITSSGTQKNSYRTSAQYSGYDKAFSIPTYEMTGSGNEIFNQLATQFRNGQLDTADKIKSPDLIGSSGNLYGDYDSDNEKYTIPDLKPSIDGENDLTPLTEQEWLSLANEANNNTNGGNYPDNVSVFDNLIDSIKVIPTPVPEPDPEPDPDPYPDLNPNPDPETVPLPDVNPYPDNYPVTDPETVPDDKPQPEYTEKATENETDIIEGDPYTTPDLLNKFPFCIPRDILNVFKKLDSGARQAPHIQWKFNPNNMIDYTFDIDFSTWDSVASLLRILELLAFIIALGIATRNLILS